jgi:hypothetical protein
VLGDSHVDVLVIRAALVRHEHAGTSVHGRAELLPQPLERARLEGVRLAVPVYTPEDDDGPRLRLNCTGSHALSMRSPG